MALVYVASSYKNPRHPPNVFLTTNTFPSPPTSSRYNDRPHASVTDSSILDYLPPKHLHPFPTLEMPPKAADKKPASASKAPATASKAPEKKDAGKKTAASGDKKKRTKTRKETYSSYIYKGMF